MHGVCVEESLEFNGVASLTVAILDAWEEELNLSNDTSIWGRSTVESVTRN